MHRSRVMSHLVWGVTLVIGSLSLGCATTFTGDPHVPGHRDV
jgi:hypothetical protein